MLWSLSHSNVRVEEMVIEHELGTELMAIVEDLTLSSSCQQAAVGFLLLLSNRKETLAQLGGAQKLCQVVVDLTKKSIKVHIFLRSAHVCKRLLLPALLPSVIDVSY